MVKGISDSSGIMNMKITADVPGERPQIGIFGRRNAGKSSLFNLLVGQNLAIVSETKGTTTDPVRKTMELEGVGSVTVIDTPGYDDDGTLGYMRVEQSVKSAASCNVAIVLIDGREDQTDRRWIDFLEGKGASVLILKREDISSEDGFCDGARDIVLDKVRMLLSKGKSDDTILGGLVREGDIVVLVMPQDKAAPKGRLIMPQMQTIRELLDRGCIPVCVSPERLGDAITGLACKPALVVTDSQAFAAVRAVMEEKFGTASVPEREYAETDRAVLSDVSGGVPLTSFSILFSRYKGDFKVFSEGASMISGLTPDSRVLIAEACAHRPLSEDIGRVKLPALLRKKVGDSLKIDVVAGSDWPSDLSGYDLVIHCGACMFNRQHVLSRIEDARRAGVPITNYGLAISSLTRK